jgi:hypothetical protein
VCWLLGVVTLQQGVGCLKHGRSVQCIMPILLLLMVSVLERWLSKEQGDGQRIRAADLKERVLLPLIFKREESLPLMHVTPGAHL